MCDLLRVGILLNVLMQKNIVCACNFRRKADLQQLRGELNVEV